MKQVRLKYKEAFISLNEAEKKRKAPEIIMDAKEKVERAGQEII